MPTYIKQFDPNKRLERFKNYATTFSIFDNSSTELHRKLNTLHRKSRVKSKLGNKREISFFILFFINKHWHFTTDSKRKTQTRQTSVGAKLANFWGRILIFITFISLMERKIRKKFRSLRVPTRQGYFTRVRLSKIIKKSASLILFRAKFS